MIFSAHYAFVMSRWPLLRRGGVGGYVVGTGPCNLSLSTYLWAYISLREYSNLYSIHTDKSFFELCSIKPNFDCNYTFPIDLAPNEIRFGVKSTRKKKFNSKFGFN